MNILVHCVYYAPELGGLESHVVGLCRELARRGHTVSVVTSRSQPGLPAREVMDGVQVHRTWMPSKTPAGWFLHAAGSTSCTRAVAERADIVHAQAFPSVLPCALALAGASTPVVTTLHTSHFLRLARRPVINRLLGKLLELSDYNLAASKEIADVGESLSKSISVEVMVNGVDTDVFRPVGEARHGRGGRRRLLVPRRLVPKNGVEFFVRALPVIATQEDVEALVIGDGPEHGKLSDLANELGVGDRIRFLGLRDHQEMPALLSSGELAVFPSLMEATSVAALESMACGLPVAASDVGGLPEIVDDRVGGLFPPGDPAALAAKVLVLLADPNLAARGQAARKRVVKLWSNDRLVDRHLEVYRELLGTKHG